MADRTVSVVLQARITDYMTKLSAASKATSDFAKKVDVAKGKAAQGYHEIGVAGVAVGAVVAGGFAVAIKSAADFQAKMALVATLSHASAKDVGQLSDAALHVGQQFGYTANQVADAEAELVKAGISVSDIMGGALTGALTLASAGQTDVATATEIAASAMTQFGLSGKDVPHIADLLAAGADKALGSVQDLGYALSQAGPTAHQFGLSIEETVGTLAAFAQAGQTGERGGTILQQVLLKLAAPGKNATAILKDLGISLYDTNGQFVGMSRLAGELHDGLSGLTLAERNHDLAVIFGARAIRGANILYQDGAKGIADWTDKVNASGFAALQQSGKLNSLQGDVTKLGVALKTAFIQGGEGEQGPLRSLTQDITGIVNAWNGLPGPVRGGAEALTAAAGAVTLAGGAAVLFIPKWVAMNAALKETSVGAISATGALGALGKVGAVGTAVVGVYEGIKALSGLLDQNASPSVEQYTTDLVNLGVAADQIATGIGPDLARFMQIVSDPSLILSNRFGLVTANAKNLDAAFVGLVQGGHADVAAKDFGTLAAKMQKAGLTTSEINALFPQYAQALNDSATSAKLAGNGIDKFGNHVGAAAKQTRTAAQAAKAYSNQLHALADPLFAMNQALQGVTDAQGAAAAATRKYGKDSAQARQANLQLASAALEAESAARTLAASVADGSVSIGDARKFLKDWVADGLLTKDQAQNVTDSFDHLIGRAQTLSNIHPHMTVTADTTQAVTALDGLNAVLNHVINGFLGLPDVTPGRKIGGAPDLVGMHQPTIIPPAPTSTKKHTTSTTSDTGYVVPYSDPGASSGGSGGGGGSGSGAGSKEKPPTTQEIVRAILEGTIPASIDQLSKILQKEIGHLSTVIQNAEQYRSTIRSGLTGYAGLSNMGTGEAGTDILGASGPASKVNVDAYLKGRANKLKQFAHLLKRLDNEGLDKPLLSQFAQIGPDAIPAMQQLLGMGKHGIHRANRYETEIRRYAGQATTTAVNDKYATQLIRSVDRLPGAIQKGVIKGLKGANFRVGWDQGDRKGGHKVRTAS